MRGYLASFLFLFISLSSFATNQSPQSKLASMLEQVMPCVVNIVMHPEPSPNRNLTEQPPVASLGSGVIVDSKKGYILTNSHLMQDKIKRIIVNLNDGRRFKAHLIGHDKLSDIAVLQIKANKLRAIHFSDSDQLRVGDSVTAIGSPFGLNQTVTSGIVSALQRTDLDIEGPEGYENFIQTDASINPGNSGGALVTSKGDLVGINTAIFAPSGGNVGIGFAIPSNMARDVMHQLIRYGKNRTRHGGCDDPKYS